MPPAPSHVTTGNSGTELSAVSGPQAHRINPSTFWAGGAQPNNPSASYAPTLTQAHNAAGGGDASLPSLDRCVLTSCAWVGPCPGLLCASLLARLTMFPCLYLVPVLNEHGHCFSGSCPAYHTSMFVPLLMSGLRCSYVLVLMVSGFVQLRKSGSCGSP
eukprot:scaffold142899_cov19-Tisochrysis_lutea.AAC.2